MAADLDQIVKWRVIYQLSLNRYVFDIVPVPASGHASAVIHEICRRRHARWPRLKAFVHRTLLFRVPTVAVASLAVISYDARTFNPYPCEVIIATREDDHVLTQAFQSSRLLNGAAPFLNRYRMFEADKTLQDAGVEGACCLVSYGIDRARLGIALLLLVLLCIVLGTVAGLVSNSIDVGFLFGCGAVTFVTAIEAIVFWMFI